MSYCNNQTPTCDTCSDAGVQADCNALTFATGLADATYWSTIIDKFGKGHTVQVDVVGGNVTLDTADYPEAFFNSMQGSYELFFHTLEETYTRLTLTIDGSTYKCIIFTLSLNCC